MRSHRVVRPVDRQTPAWGSCGVPVPTLQCAVFAVYGNACTDATVADYLIGGALPPDDATCIAQATAAGTASVGGRAGR